MGFIEVSDGTGNRRIRIPDLVGEIRIETAGTDAPRVVLSEEIAVERHPSADQGNGGLFADEHPARPETSEADR